MLNVELLKKLFPKTRLSILDKYVEPLNIVCKYYNIFENNKRLAAFLAQTGHESGGFNFIVENLNYSVEGLRTTFSKYFPDDEIAAIYARKPEKIANRVYANRMDNGDESSGDGWKFRGRGLIQITGRENYTKLSSALELDIESTIAYLETTNGATVSAGWFWDTNRLNQFADRDDFITLTKRINGGTNGLQDRMNYYELALKYVGI